MKNSMTENNNIFAQRTSKEYSFKLNEAHTKKANSELFISSDENMTIALEPAYAFTNKDS